MFLIGQYTDFIYGSFFNYELNSFCIEISSAAQVTLLKPSFSRSKRADENKTRCSSGKYISKFVCVDGHISDSSN